VLRAKKISKNRNNKSVDYFDGKALYGDKFSFSEIKEWYKDEEEGYAELGAKDSNRYEYVYHALNVLHGFKHVPDRSFIHALGFGSAYGDEFKPIADRIEHLTIIEPSETFVRDVVHGISATYVKPEIAGALPFPDDTFDLIFCLGVLHHIPNVTDVVKELYRCLQTDGFMLVREPVVSMGDWNNARPGLTRRERGIPLQLFRELVNRVGFTVVKESLCVFPLIPRLSQIFSKAAYNSNLITRVDYIFSRLLRWNLQYHASSRLRKMRPTNVYYVLTKKRLLASRST